MKTKNSSAKIIKKRHDALRRIIVKFNQNGSSPTRKELLSELAKKGFKIDYSTLYRDRTSINAENSFIEDISRYNYSAYVEDIWDKLDWIIDNSMENYHKNIPITKKIEHEKNGVIETTIQKIENKSDSRYKFLRLILDASMAKFSMMRGDSINVSVALLEKKFQQLRDENIHYKDEYEQKATAFEELKKSLVEGKNICK